MAARKNKPPIPDLLSESEALAVLVGDRDQARLSQVPIEQLDPNPFNPRQHLDVTELVESMRAHGFMGALDGRRRGDRVQLAYGARRLLAARQAGIRQIPVYIHEWDDQTMLVLGLVENVQREDLTPLEAAHSMKRMNEELGWSQEEIARRTGKNRSWVRDMLALASAPDDLQELVRERPDASRHVRYLAQVEDEAARAVLAEAVREREVTAQQLYKVVQAIGQGMSAEEALRSARTPPPSVTMPPTIPEAVAPSAGVSSAPPAQNEVSAAPPTRPRGPQVRAPADVVALLDYIAHRLSRLAVADLNHALETDPEAVRRALAAVQAELDRLHQRIPARNE